MNQVTTPSFQTKLQQLLTKVQENYSLTMLRSQTNCSDLILALSSKADLCNELACVINRHREDYDQVEHGPLLSRILKKLGVVMSLVQSQNSDAIANKPWVINMPKRDGSIRSSDNDNDNSHSNSVEFGQYAGHSGSNKLISRSFGYIYTQISSFGCALFNQLPSTQKVLAVRDGFNRCMLISDKNQSFSETRQELQFILEVMVDLAISYGIYDNLTLEKRKSIIGLLCCDGSIDKKPNHSAKHSS